MCCRTSIIEKSFVTRSCTKRSLMRDFQWNLLPSRSSSPSSFLSLFSSFLFCVPDSFPSSLPADTNRLSLKEYGEGGELKRQLSALVLMLGWGQYNLHSLSHALIHIHTHTHFFSHQRTCIEVRTNPLQPARTWCRVAERVWPYKSTLLQVPERERVTTSGNPAVMAAVSPLMQLSAPSLLLVLLSLSWLAACCGHF